MVKNIWAKIVVMLKQCCKCVTGALDVCRLQIKKLHRSFFIVSVVFPLICFMTVYQVPDGEISHGSAVG